MKDIEFNLVEPFVSLSFIQSSSFSVSLVPQKICVQKLARKLWVNICHLNKQ